MDAQIAIPDLDDDTIYNINADDSSLSIVNEAPKPRPFRGAELYQHSRSGSAVSADSSNGSKFGGGSTLMTNGGSSGSGSRQTNGTSSNNNVAGSSSSSFPRKASFASLKAAIKGQQSAPHPNQAGSETYPTQLRNPFPASSSTYADANRHHLPADGTRSHSRDESLGSSASRNKAQYMNMPQTIHHNPRHNYQNSLHSDHSAGMNGSLPYSMSESTGISTAMSQPSMPPLPPFPEAFQGRSAPPAKTAYARSLSSRAYATSSSVDEVPMTAPLPMQSYHGRAGSSQSFPDPHSAPLHYIPDSMGGYTQAGEEPLLPPQPLFAETWQHGRGASGGSVPASDDGGRSSFDHMQRGGQTPVASSSQRWQHQQSNGEARSGGGGGGPIGFFQVSENASHATLPSGVGLEVPVTPSEYAINVLCSRFVTLAGVRIRGAMGGVDESDPLLQRILGPQADPSLDTLLDSLAHLSRKNAKPVIDSLFRWRANMLDEKVDVGEVRGALAGSQASLNLGVRDIANVLTRRKFLSTAFLLARAMSQVAEHFVASVDGRISGLSDSHTVELQEASFELMKDCSRDRSMPSRMQMEAFEATTHLLGVISKSGFAAIGDRFLDWLQQCQKFAPTTSSSSKEGDPSVETAILAMGHLVITPYPMELFEEGADFLHSMAKHFATAHGQRIKSAYAEAITRLLLPVAKSATAELHHPTWIKALDSIGPRALSMLSKPRYWSIAYPLYVAVLCVSPEDKFLASAGPATSGVAVAGLSIGGSAVGSNSQGQGLTWFACLESGVAKLNKDRGVRNVVLNAAIYLLWTYIFRCRESSSTTTKRLDSFFRIWFPPGRPTIVPADMSTSQAHITLVHLVLYRHFDFGRDLVLDFMRHQSLSGNTLNLQPELLSKQRMSIAIRAILLTLDSYVRGESPPLPLDFNQESESETKGDELPETFTYPRPEIEKAHLQFNDLIGKIALLCDHQVGSVSIFDEQVAIYRGLSVSSAMASQKSSGDDDRLTWKVHPAARFVTAYNKDHQSTMDLLRACFDSWPRCLSSSIPFASVLSLLFKAHFSADPLLAEAASKCLLRIASQRKGGASAVVGGFLRCVFRQDSFCWEHHPNQMAILSKVDLSIKFWIDCLEVWFLDLKRSQSAVAGQSTWEMERVSAWPVIDEVEAIGLFLLCSAWRTLRRRAVGVLRIVAKLDDLFVSLSSQGKNESASPSNGEEEEPTRIIHLLDMPSSRFDEELTGGREEYTDPIKALERSKNRKWKRSSHAKESLGELAASDKSKELSNWLDMVPRFLQLCLDHFPTTVAVFRSFVTTRVLWMESAVSMAAGTSNRFNTASTSNNTLKGQSGSGSGVALTFNANGSLSAEQGLMAEHWKMYILSLCTTTTSIEGQNRSSKGETAASGDRVFAAKDLFQRLVPFMASDHARFRDAVVSSLGNININLYKTLLETMQTVSAQLSEDFKTTRSGARRSKRHERLRTAVAHVIQLTSPHMIRVMPDPNVVFLLLQWIKETFNFLTDKEVRGDWEFHRLRRFFAGVVEEFFNSLHMNASEDTGSDRYLTFETKLRMFRLFREWHSFSQAAKDGPAKLANLLATVAEQYREDRNREGVLTLLRNETQLLSFQASSAMAALCQGVITLVGSAVPAPMSGSHLDTDSLLEWLRHLFLSPSPQNHAVARRALKALLLHNINHENLVTKTSDQAFVEPEQTTASRSFFAVLSEVLYDKRDRTMLPLEQILCLGLIKLGHPDPVMRKKAFALLSSISSSRQNSTAPTSLQAFEGGVSSPLPATYLRAQRDVSTYLAEQFPDYKVAMLCEYTRRLPSIDLIRRATTLGLLPEWLHQIDLVDQGYASGSVVLPKKTMLVLSNLLSLTIKYGDEHNFEIQDTWASLAEGPHYALNASVVVKFLIQQALYLRSSPFITHAKRAISCLSHTVLAPALFSELCSYIEPSSMIPVPLELENMSLPDPSLEHLYMSSIETLLPPPSRKQTFSPGQVAILFVGELTYDKSYLLVDKLPLLLHVIFMNVDSLSAFTQEQVMAMFEQLLRSLSAERGSSELNSQVNQFFTKGTSIVWSHDDIDMDLDASHTPRTMRSTILETLSILRDIFPSLNEQWGNVALHWATSNPVRHMACRSFQAFRTLLPKVNYTMLADILGRLSNTISDSTRFDNQTFALEILYTLKAIVQSIRMESLSANERQSNRELLCHVYWMNVACLSTVNEAEFGQSIELLHVLLDRLEMNSEETLELLRAKCPDGWEGEMGGLQGLVMRGLKSSTTSHDSFHLLARLAKVGNDQLIDQQDSRLGFLFLASLPWFLQMTDEPNGKEEGIVIGLAEDIASLAAKRNKADIQRVATSIAKKRFRTKDDLVRQAINCCIRTGFLPNHAKGSALLLLGLTFNSQDWLRRQTLEILKIFFQSVDTKREDFYLLGSELLMPLLRLLNTNLSLQALEVLEEKIVLMASSSGQSDEERSGPTAQQILRMSLQWGKATNANMMRNRPKQRAHLKSASQGVNEVNSLFGQAEESGWSIPNLQDYTTRTRINILSVFKSVELLLDTPPVGEVNFVDDYDADENVFETTLTVSRNEGDEEIEDGRSDRLPRAIAATTSEHHSTQPSAHSINSLEQRSVADLGDIVNQLHDLSSFFVDGDNGEGAYGEDDDAEGGDQAMRYGHVMRPSTGNNSTSSHEQIAKILSRRAINAFTGLQTAGSFGSSGGASVTESNSGQSLRSAQDGMSNGVRRGEMMDENPSSSTMNKRGGVWSRKSLFGGGKRSASSQNNLRTTPTAESSGRADYFADS